MLTEKQQKYQRFYDKNKLDKYEYLTVEEILLSDQSRMIKQAKSSYSLLVKATEKQTKAIENQRKKTSLSLKSFKTNRTKTNNQGCNS